jgi:hypothetical protein
MSIEDAKRTLKGMGKTITHNTPGPKQLWQGFKETHTPALIPLIAIAILLLFGEPFCRWLTH